MILINLSTLDAPPTPCIAQIITGGHLPKGASGIWSIENELKPSDLYCYLTAKFGPPNGIHNILRNDDSDNMIHWDWTLVHQNGLILILGLNMRTEVQFIGDWDFPKISKTHFINGIKEDFKNHGKEMSRFRKENLENWDLFVNPYHNLSQTLYKLSKDIDDLELNPENEEIPNPSVSGDYERFTKNWEELTSKYLQAMGIAMGIRTMTPIKAEAFLNLIIFVLCKPEIKKNTRVYENFIRSNIDIKVQTINLHCNGFIKAIDWKSDQCAAYNSLINERNDLLHGNISIDKLKFREIFFLGKVPIFKEYKSMWHQSIGTSIDASGLKNVKHGLKIVDDFEKYILSCLDTNIKENIEMILNKSDLGFNNKTGRVGILLPDHITDFSISTIHETAKNK